MLRIDLSRQGPKAHIKVEGRLVGPWVAELEGVLAALEDPQALTLDLEGVSHADEAGLAVLRRALARGARISSVSGFVARLLWDLPVKE